MGFNPRIYVKSFHNTLIKDNLFIIAFTQFKRLINIYSEFPKKSQKISKNLFDNKAKLEKAKSIVNSGSRHDKFSSFNLIQ